MSSQLRRHNLSVLERDMRNNGTECSNNCANMAKLGVQEQVDFSDLTEAAKTGH
jgi:hypothetical protein